MELHHNGAEEEIRFILKPVRWFKTALERQISEAVRIRRYGADVVLNSKSEFNRCEIRRLTIEHHEPEGEDPVLVQREEVVQGELDLWQEGKGGS